MSVLFIQGWDLDSKTGNADLPGLQDYGKYYYTVPLHTQEYTTGYITGRAIVQDENAEFAFTGGSVTNANSIPVGQSPLRVTWFARRRNVTASSITIWYGFMMVNVNGTPIGVQINRNGQCRIARGGFYPGPPVLNPTDTTIEAMSAASTGIIGTDYVFCDFYMNLATNTFTFKMDGVTECTGSLAVPQLTNANRPVPVWNHAENYVVDLDHLIVTDGEDLVGTERIHALAPTAAYAGAGTLRGNMIINDASYQSQRDAAATYPHSFGGDNNANVVYWLYGLDPSTAEPWEEDILSTLQGWGVCSGNLVDGGNKLHMTSLGLSIVETTSDPDGYPIISVLSPNGLTYYSGDWEKSNPNVSLSGHLNDIPRTVLFSEDLYLETDVEGCMLFAPQDLGLLDTFGITFAEEFREDFTDWFRIIYGGIPFVSYFITGYTILGDGNKQFQSNYVSVNYENVPVGGAYLQGVWDYSLSGDSGRWGTRQQVYRLSSSNYKYQVSKLKVRGQGTSMQIKVTSEEGKDFRLSGWSVLASGNSSV